MSTISKADAGDIVTQIAADVSDLAASRRDFPSQNRDAEKEITIANGKDELLILTIGDPHFKVSNIRESEEMSDAIVSLAKERKPDIIVCLGDILDRHETIHVTPLTHSIKFLYRLEKLAPLYVIIGNHDRPNNSDFLSDQHPFNAVKMWSNTTVVDKVVDAKYTVLDKKYRFIFVPYVPPGKFEGAIATVDTPLIGTSAFFAHQEFFGAKMGAIVSMDGDKWPHINPLVISGHIHDYGRPQENIIYTGTPMQHAFGDREDKTISLFTFKHNQVDISSDEKSNGDVIWKEERIELPLTRRAIVYLKTTQILEWKPPHGKLIKAVIRGTSAEIKAAMKLQYVKQLIKEGVKVVYKTIEDGSEEIKDLSSISPQVPYLQKLGETVNSDPGQKMWFEKLFGSVSQPTSRLKLNLI